MKPIDYMLSSDLTDFNVIDSGANLSDHLVLQLMCTYNPEYAIDDYANNDMRPTVTHLRWDCAIYLSITLKRELVYNAFLQILLALKKTISFVSHQRALSNTNW